MRKRATSKSKEIKPGALHPGDARLASFLARYAAWMMGCGATCERVERNVGRIAEAYDCPVRLNLMPRHVSVAVTDENGSNPLFFSEGNAPCGINFTINAALSALSWDISEGRVNFDEAERRFGHICHRAYGNPWKILLLASLANASFCRLFGGDAWAMGVVFLATAAGFFMKQRLLKWGVDVRIVFFLCAFISAVLCGGAVTLGVGATPGIALATSVLYLIPGVPYLNTASDMIARHYICAIGRGVDAIVLTAMLSAGFCLGVYCMGNSMTW